VFGEATADALRRADELATYRGLRQRRIDYYERIANANPKLKKFLRGWLNRVAVFPVL
jgi:type VI secretion system secreted protein VgrG